ncbi:ThiF family adenylyltransferase [Lysinibacillus irui]|uniref:ThiF family adenylyltransferase n=1 Tax=Lysinibacillus irui TaxID=2998077 RepID=A0AAJ5RQ85_9BACI|nr:ThiF family adenylyltransferase [Lysinibacillus irui]WDV09248.1 ThiF family adenylyltransferase [Lysinibacillus irui]
MKILYGQNLDIVLIGVGANGSHFLRNLLQDMSLYGRDMRKNRLLIADGDKTEEKNIKNQLFTPEDIGEYKVNALAERYGDHYGIDVLAVPDYITDCDMLERLFANDGRFKILIGCVDNNRTRQLMHDYFNYVSDLLYIDVGVEGVILKEELKDYSYDEMNRMIIGSGFSGQVVVGFKTNGELILPPICDVYPNVLSDTESVFPTQNCTEILNNPQRLETNKMAAQMANIIMNNLFHTGEIYQHEILFNARYGSSNARFIEARTEKYFKELQAQSKSTAAC